MPKFEYNYTYKESSGAGTIEAKSKKEATEKVKEAADIALPEPNRKKKDDFKVELTKLEEEQENV